VALTLTINAVDKTSLLLDASLEVEKVGSTERCDLDIVDRDDSTASAYRPAVGDVVRLLHNADLLMGGPIVRVEDRRLAGDTGTVTRISVRDWLFLAEQVIIEDRYFAPQGAFALFDDLVTTYLADKGVTNISSSTTGGPVLPELWVQHETLLSVFTRIAEQTGYPFRINGDKQCALVEPGTLAGPVTLTTTNILDGARWTQNELRQANRLFLQTGTPESGAGPVTHSETHTADGTLKIFPVNVIPNRSLLGRIDNAAGYSSGTASIKLKGLTPGMVVLQNNSFTIDGQVATYVVQSDVTVAEDGTVTVSISPTLVANVDDEQGVTFSDETGIALEVNGTPTDLFGSPWVWDRADQAVTNPSAAPTNGTAITVTSRVTFPAWVRVWETSSPNVQTAVGAFDRTILVDGVITEDGQAHTDLAQAAAYGRDKLTQRLSPPKIVRAVTYEPGWYPYLSATVTWAARLLSGSYLVDAVRVRAVGIDPAVTTNELPYELELVEGDLLRQSWVDFYRGANPTRGIRWGALPGAVLLSQSVIEVLIDPPEEALLSQAVIEVPIRNTSTDVLLSQSSIEVLIA